jgi:hypothetical protein
MELLRSHPFIPTKPPQLTYRFGGYMLNILDHKRKPTSRDIVAMVSAIQTLCKESESLYNQYQNQPQKNSIIAQEERSFPEPDMIADARSRGLLSMEAAADHLMVFVEAVKEPAKTLATWTCVRGLLESAAIALWFLDFEIDATTRVARVFSFRYEGYTQQIKICQDLGDENSITNFKETIKTQLNKSGRTQ